MARFTLPRDIYHGKNALEALKSFQGKKAVVCVGGSSMKKFGFLDKAVSYLQSAGMEVKIIEGIEPDPSVETVMRGAETMIEFQPDWIVAIGGGSPIDAAKAMWIKYEYPETTFEDMCKIFGLPKLRTKAKFCAVSSTSGTATEVTAFSIITDYAKGIKYPIADFEITEIMLNEFIKKVNGKNPFIYVKKLYFEIFCDIIIKNLRRRGRQRDNVCKFNFNRSSDLICLNFIKEANNSQSQKKTASENSINLVISGNGTLFVNGNEYALEEGSLFFIIEGDEFSVN